MKFFRPTAGKALFASALLSFALASCSDDSKTGSSHGEVIRLTTKVHTKAASIDAQLPASQRIGVFITENAVSPTAVYENNITYTADGLGNLSGVAQQYPDNGNAVLISAYHPYSESANDDYEFTVAQDQISDNDTYVSDLLYCAALTQAPTSESVILSFRHQLSLVTYNLTSGDGSPDLTNAAVSAVDVATTIGFNRRTGSLGTVSNRDEVLFGAEGGIIVPQTVAAGNRFLKIRLASGEELYYTPNTALVLESGKRYTLNLRVNLKTDVTLNTATFVEDWDTGFVINDDVSKEKYNLRKDLMLGMHFFGAWVKGTTHVVGNSTITTDFPERESELGWYNCETPEDVSTQIGWAVDAGITFFSFDWYHGAAADKHYSNVSHNRALTYFKQVNNGRMKYCIHAINESAGNSYAYTPEVWNEAKKFWIQELSNPREDYLRVDGLPLFVLYNGKDLETTLGSEAQVKQEIATLRQDIRNNGGGEILIAVCNWNLGSAYNCGVDILTQYNLGQLAYKAAGVTEDSGLMPVDSKYLLEGDNTWATNSFLKNWSNPDWTHLRRLKYIPLATTGYDARPALFGNSPAEVEKTRNKPYFVFSEEQVYQSVSNLVKWIDDHHGQGYSMGDKIGFIYAWNEYNEGSWMLPSKDGSLVPLNGVKRAIAVKP